MEKGRAQTTAEPVGSESFTMPGCDVVPAATGARARKGDQMAVKQLITIMTAELWGPVARHLVDAGFQVSHERSVFEYRVGTLLVTSFSISTVLLGK